MERRQDVSVVRLHDILLERTDDLLRWRNNDLSSVRLQKVSNETRNNVLLLLQQDVSVVYIPDILLVRPYDASCKFQIKRPLTSLWYASTKSQSYVVVVPC